MRVGPFHAFVAIAAWISACSDVDVGSSTIAGTGATGSGGTGATTAAGSGATTGSGGATGGSGTGGSSSNGGGLADATPGATDPNDSGSDGAGSSDGTLVNADAARSDGPAPTDGGGSFADAAPMPSSGCGKPAGQALATYVRKNVTGMNRVYDLYVPTGYDPMRAYRTLFIAHGCDGSIPYHIETVTKGDAIIVAPRALSSQRTGQPYGGGCFDTGPGSASLTEVAYFDQVLVDVSSALCVDTARVFMAGHSSGSWLTNLLGCARAGALRGQGNSAGGLPVVPMCSGPIAAMLAHDRQDDQNAFVEGEKARDRILKINGCGTETLPYDWDGNPATPSTCVMYQGCKPGYPVVWCPTMGKGHSDQIPVTTVGLWRFWSQF